MSMSRPGRQREGKKEKKEKEKLIIITHFQLEPAFSRRATSLQISVLTRAGGGEGEGEQECSERATPKSKASDERSRDISQDFGLALTKAQKVIINLVVCRDCSSSIWRHLGSVGFVQ